MLKIYAIAVLVGFAVFVGLYVPASRARVQREQAAIEEVLRRQEAAEAKRLEDELAARRAEEERRVNRDREERERQAAVEAEELARQEQIRASTATLLRELQDLEAEIERLRAESNRLRDQRLRLQTEVFEARRAAERARSDLRVGQFEMQRLLDLLAKRLATEPFLIPPPEPRRQNSLQ
jgi:cell division protein FtsB